MLSSKHFATFLKNKPQKQTSCLLSLIVILLQPMSYYVRKNNSREGCLLHFVMFVLLLKSSCVKTNNTELWVCKSLGSLPKPYEKQTAWVIICFSPNFKVN